MEVEVIPLPRDLQPLDLPGRSVVVFDVLRATTTMTAALSVGVSEIRIFADLASAKAASEGFPRPRLLCGEQKALRPPGFDLGNSPRAFTRDAHAGKTVFMSTTNGTRAILAARGAASIFTGALVNAGAVAAALIHVARPVTLLCSGTDGAISLEDLIGAGSVLSRLEEKTSVVTRGDGAPIARHLFHSARNDLLRTLTESQGSKNVIAAGLTPDIAFAARLDAFDVVGAVFDADDAPVVRAWSSGMA